MRAVYNHTGLWEDEGPGPVVASVTLSDDVIDLTLYFPRLNKSVSIDLTDDEISLIRDELLTTKNRREGDGEA